MPRMRTFKPDFCRNEKVARLTLNAQLHFIKLWTYADDEGRGRDNPKLIKGEIWPLDDEVTTERIETWQEELRATGCLVRYVIEGVAYFQIHDFADHQKPQHPTKSKLPAPDYGQLKPVNPQTTLTSHENFSKAHEDDSNPLHVAVAGAVAGDVVVDVEVAGGESKDFVELVDRMVSVCSHNDKQSRNEAREITGFLLNFIDSKIIDEEIGRVESRPTEKRPNLPRYFLKPIRDRASKAGIPIPEHVQYEKIRELREAQ